jgi:hypothetical protein
MMDKINEPLEMENEAKLTKHYYMFITSHLITNDPTMLFETFVNNPRGSSISITYRVKLLRFTSKNIRKVGV